MHAIIIMFEISISRFSMNYYSMEVTIVMDSGNTYPKINFILQKRLLEVESIHFQKLSNIAKKNLKNMVKNLQVFKSCLY